MPRQTVKVKSKRPARSPPLHREEFPHLQLRKYHTRRGPKRTSGALITMEIRKLLQRSEGEAAEAHLRRLAMLIVIATRMTKRWRT